MKKVIAAVQTLVTANRFRVNAVGFCGKIVTELYGASLRSANDR